MGCNYLQFFCYSLDYQVLSSQQYPDYAQFAMSKVGSNIIHYIGLFVFGIEPVGGIGNTLLLGQQNSRLVTQIDRNSIEYVLGF